MEDKNDSIQSMQRVPKNWWKDNSVKIWAQDMNRKLRESENQMTRKYIEICPTLLVVKEMQVTFVNL